ncbi:MAG: prolyl oligopeptidase family serine peptidase, partial [Candidatus Promineifilaceae bacterium]
WGTVDYDDVMAWADYMASQPYIDTARMGVTGGSYGGYMTTMIIGRTQWFKAAVTQRGVNNLISMWGSSDFNWAFQQSLGQNKPPFNNLDHYWQQSPMKYIGNAKTPTKVIHSQADYRVAQEQGEQVFVALKRLGIDTELVLFPDEPHGLSRNGRTDRRIVRLNHILGWFEKYLK